MIPRTGATLGRRTSAALGALLALGSVLGCALGSDLLNAEALVWLGLDPGTIIPARGSVLIAFTNDTPNPVEFHAYTASDAADLSKGARNYFVEAPPGQTLNEVIDCPIGLVSLGTVGEDLMVDRTGAIVRPAAEAAVAVAYTGAELPYGSGLSCGDVVAVRIRGSGTEGDPYTISVRVLRWP